MYCKHHLLLQNQSHYTTTLMVRKHNYIPLKCATSKNISNKENKDDKEGEKRKTKRNERKFVIFRRYAVLLCGENE
jgi:hypothetical protein